MKFYILRDSHENNRGWVAMLPADEENIIHLKENMTYGKLWNGEETIRLSLVNIMPEKPQDSFCDIHKWGHNLGLNMVPPPSANVLVISPRLKTVLENFSLPEHSFYKAILRKGILKNSEIESHRFYKENVIHDHPQEERNYFIVQIVNDSIKDLQFQECIFEIRKVNDERTLVKTLKKGEIKDYSHFAEINSYEFQYNDQNIRPQTYIYRQPWSILSGTGKSIIVSEKVKQVIEETNLTGISLEEFTEYEIITGYQEA